jgi:PAS domain S-box-containing protein
VARRGPFLNVAQKAGALSVPGKKPMLDTFFTMDIPAGAEKGTYQFPLVILSYVVASAASYTALVVSQMLLGATNLRERRLFHWGGAFAMGAGIWSMHFIGMLSYKMTMTVTYDPWMTFLSLVLAVVASWGALGIVTREKLPFRNLAIGGFLMGIGICSMHYTGMAAMNMDAALRYAPEPFVLSFIIAVAASMTALWIAFTLARHGSPYRDLYQIGAAMIMGAAICGMHYTGMAAAVFIPFAQCRRDAGQNFTVLAWSIAGMTGLVLGMALAVAAYRKAEAERKLQASEARLRAVIDSSLDAVMSIDQLDRITEWNRQAETMFGWPRAEALGRRLAETVILPRYRPSHYAGLAEFLRSGQCPYVDRRVEIDAVRRDGSVFPIEVSVTAQRSGGEYQFNVFARDITERRTAQAELERYTEALERSNQELDDFAHIASHDMKEPLRGIAIQANFLTEDYGDKLDEKGRQRLQRLIHLSKRMEQLVTELLYYSQLGRSELAVQETDLNAAVDGIRPLLEQFLKERNGHIIVPKPLPRVVCDKLRVTEALRNLITNAIKYNDKADRMAEVGFLDSVDTDHGPETSVFYVRDNGVGIAPEYHDEVFRIFRRLHNATEKETGTGAGLTFVKRIVERHHGRIWIESIPGKSTTFYFTLKPSGHAA